MHLINTIKKVNPLNRKEKAQVMSNIMMKEIQALEGYLSNSLHLPTSLNLIGTDQP